MSSLKEKTNMPDSEKKNYYCRVCDSELYEEPHSGSLWCDECELYPFKKGTYTKEDSE